MTKPTGYYLSERKQTILTIAEEVFAEHGFAGATIRLITKKSGVNSSMISYYFGSKEALYLNIFKVRLAEIADEVTRFEAVDLGPVERLRAYLTAYIGRITANQGFYRLLCNELLTMQHPVIIAQVSKTRDRIHDFLLKTIKNGTGKGYFKKIDGEVFVLNILALARSVFTDQLTNHIHLNKPPQEDLSLRIADYMMSIVVPELEPLT